MYLYPFVQRCASKFAVRPPETTVYIMLFVCFFLLLLLFSSKISVKYIHFSLNVSYSVYPSYFIHLIHSIGRFTHICFHTFEKERKEKKKVGTVTQLISFRTRKNHFFSGVHLIWNWVFCFNENRIRRRIAISLVLMKAFQLDYWIPTNWE